MPLRFELKRPAFVNETIVMFWFKPHKAFKNATVARARETLCPNCCSHMTAVEKNILFYWLW